MKRSEWLVPEGAAELLTPALIFHAAGIRNNIQKMLEIAGTPDRLWPHVKTHKTKEIVRMAQSMGIERFKAATLEEAVMLAECKAAHILLAYPLVGPAQNAYCRIAAAYTESHFYALADDFGQLKELLEKAVQTGVSFHWLADVNAGTDRTGVAMDELADFVRKAAEQTGEAPAGVHVYDGHLSISDPAERRKAVKAYRGKLNRQIAAVRESGISMPICVLGGSPTFPCHAEDSEVFVSPGTTFLWDAGYEAKYPDLPFQPAAALLCRVISHPAYGRFTLDLGYKAIASDPVGSRGRLLGVPHAHALFQNEEHWVFEMEDGYESERPAIGTLLLVIPTHICPTCALYDLAWVTENNRVVTGWRIDARKRSRRDGNMGGNPKWDDL